MVVDVFCSSLFRQVSDVHQAEVVKVIPSKFSGSKEVVPLQMRKLLAGEKRPENQDNGEVLTTKIVPTALTTSSGEEIWFEFRRQRFIFSEQLNKFCKLDYPSKEAFLVYSKSTGYGSEAKSQAALEKWGRNV
jgi:cation-transporting ATPase 13A1